MKIVISPSKTMEFIKNNKLESKEIFFIKEHKKVLAQLRKLSKTDIEQKFKIKGNLLEQTYKNIKNYNTMDSFHPFFGYNGLVYKQLMKDQYNEDEYEYIMCHLRILDAFYGVLEPTTLIKPYRLDMKIPLDINLYELYDCDSYFKEELIVNLASDEFSKMIHKKMITIHFRDYKDGKYRNLATYSKIARGKFLNQMILLKITEIDKMKEVTFDGYEINHELSDDENLYFTRLA